VAEEDNKAATPSARHEAEHEDRDRKHRRIRNEATERR